MRGVINSKRRFSGAMTDLTGETDRHTNISFFGLYCRNSNVDEKYECDDLRCCSRVFLSMVRTL